MGICGQTRGANQEAVQEKCQEFEDKLKLGNVYWRAFVETVGMYRTSTYLTDKALQTIWHELRLDAEYNDMSSPLHQLCVALEEDQKWDEYKFKLAGLLLCKTTDDEAGNFCLYLLDPKSSSDDSIIIPTHTIMYWMTLATKTLPQLAQKQPENRGHLPLFSGLNDLQFEDLAKAVERWLPKGSDSDGIIRTSKVDIVAWIKGGMLTTEKARAAALEVLQEKKAARRNLVP